MSIIPTVPAVLIEAHQVEEGVCVCVCGRQVERDSGFKTPRQTCCWSLGSPRDATWNRLPPQSPTSPPPCAVMRWSVSHPRRAPWPRASPRDTIFFSGAFLCARHPVSTFDARLGGIHTTNGPKTHARCKAGCLGRPWRSLEVLPTPPSYQANPLSLAFMVFPTNGSCPALHGPPS